MTDHSIKPKDTSPSAFPLAVQPDFQFAEPGMTLRDWFAGQALAGMAQSVGWQGGPWEMMAGHAYDAADAMLARKGQSGE